MSEPGTMDARQQRYGELLQQIGGALLDAAPPGWRRMDLIAKIAEGVQDLGLTVIRSDFSDARVAPPEHLTAAFVELRQVMDDEQRGAWLSARYTIDPPSAFQVFYNYDHDPLWDPPVPAEVPRPEAPGQPTGSARIGIEEQRALHRKIADLLVVRAPADRDQLRVMYNAVGHHEELVGHVLGIDGQLREWDAPPELTPYFRRLRAGMYAEGAGTWAAASTVVEYPIKLSIDYRNETRWHREPSRWEVLDELELYPRTADHVPDWMTTALPNARRVAEVAGRFRRARIFDRRNGDGRPVADRPAVPDGERQRLLDYLNTAPVIVSGRGFDPDVFDPDGAQDVPSGYHTDGVWIWTASVPHYLAKHAIAPEPDLVEHVRRHDFALPQLDQETREAAYLALTGELPAAPPLSERDHRVLAIIEQRVSEAGAIPEAYRILGSAEGATCLERVGDEWQVADYERGEPRGPKRFAQLWDAGAFLLGSLTIIPSSLRGGGPDRNTAQALNDWPIQPLPGEPPLTLLAEKHIAVLMPGRELVRHGADGGNLTFAAGTGFTAMSLRPEREHQGPRRYRVQRELRVLAGQTVPWHDQPGGGSAYLLPGSVAGHLADGSLTDVTDIAATGG
ncbi:TNT domain-containing protein [Jiangella endophytica]|uniref:TNT domain-containing protein n=1 Tax=Jiangella endophytica TaxID=1623398 RepID=UPI000E351BE2|nr:TNT domain-containing protein [Jiangella endophytica]